jgi:hypothetical protein
MRPLIEIYILIYVLYFLLIGRCFHQQKLKYLTIFFVLRVVTNMQLFALTNSKTTAVTIAKILQQILLIFNQKLLQ